MKKKAKKKIAKTTRKKAKAKKETKLLVSGKTLERRKRKKTVLNSGEVMETKTLPTEPEQMEFEDLESHDHDLF